MSEHNQKYFSKLLGQFFQISKKGWGDIFLAVVPNFAKILSTVKIVKKLM